MFSLSATMPASLNPRKMMKVIARATSTSTSVIPPLFFNADRPIVLPHFDPRLPDRDAVVVRVRGRREGDPDAPRPGGDPVPVEVEVRRGDRMLRGAPDNQFIAGIER